MSFKYKQMVLCNCKQMVSRYFKHIMLRHCCTRPNWPSLPAASGIDAPFWAANRDIAMRSVNAIATEAALIDGALRGEERRRYDKRRPIEEIIAEAAATIRQHFWQEGGIPEDAHVTVDISQGFSRSALHGRNGSLTWTASTRPATRCSPRSS